MSKLTAAVVITTKNRKEELLKAVSSALEQRGLAEVLVIDDGSTDRMPEVIESKFTVFSGQCSEKHTLPRLRVVRHEESKGYIVRRNEAARLVKADVIFSLDDDAVFSSPHVVEQTLREFSHPRIGAVAIPCIEPQLNNKELQRAPSPDAIWVTANYKGTAHAVRRDVFLAVGGYREELIHQGEEGDFCVRMLAHDARAVSKFESGKVGRFYFAGKQNTSARSATFETSHGATVLSATPLEAEVPGWFVRMGNSDPIIHNESPRRDYRRMDFYGRRNDILFHWQNTLMPDLLSAIPATIVGGLACAARTGRWWHMLQGIAVGLWQAPRHRRCPLPINVSRAFKRLKQKRGEKL